MSFTNPTKCPSCASPLSQGGEVGGNHKPREGDFCVCAVCGKLGVYTDKLRLRLPTVKELHECQADLIRSGFLGNHRLS